MKAIETKYLPATNTRGSRIKATCERGSITISYPSDLSGDAVHIAARQKLIEKFLAEDKARYGEAHNPWSDPMVCGQLANGHYVHVFLPKAWKA